MENRTSALFTAIILSLAASCGGGGGDDGESPILDQGVGFPDLGVGAVGEAEAEAEGEGEDCQVIDDGATMSVTLEFAGESINFSKSNHSSECEACMREGKCQTDGCVMARYTTCVGECPGWFEIMGGLQPGCMDDLNVQVDLTRIGESFEFSSDDVHAHIRVSTGDGCSVETSPNQYCPGCDTYGEVTTQEDGDFIRVDFEAQGYMQRFCSQYCARQDGCGELDDSGIITGTARFPRE